MTALSLTVEEFAERWEAEPKIAEAWLQAFAFAGFAVRLEDGRYAATPPGAAAHEPQRGAS